MRRLVILASSVLLLSAACASLILLRHPVGAGFAGAGALLSLTVLAAWPDDPGGDAGSVPRRRFAQRVLERIVEAAVLVPLAWVTRAGSNLDAVLALVGLGASYVAAYQLAKGEALGFPGSEWTVVRRAGQGVLVLALLMSVWIEAWLWAFAALSVTTAALRTRSVVVQERRRAPGTRASA